MSYNSVDEYPDGKIKRSSSVDRLQWSVSAKDPMAAAQAPTTLVGQDGCRASTSDLNNVSGSSFVTVIKADNRENMDLSTSISNKIKSPTVSDCDWEVVELLLSLKRKKNVSSYECEQCKKSFLTCVALNIHNTKKHNKKKTRTDSTLDCPCGMTFTAKWRQNCVHKLNSHGRHCKAFKEIGNYNFFFYSLSLSFSLFSSPLCQRQAIACHDGH